MRILKRILICIFIIILSILSYFVISGYTMYKDKIDEKSEKIEETKKEEKSKKDAFFIEEKPKIEKVGPFQLVVIKLPWYKRAVRSLMSFLGFYYE